MTENEFRRKKERLKQLSKNTISSFNLLPMEERLELSHQLKCSICGDKLEDSNLVYNGRLVCKHCAKAVRDELKECLQLSKEIKEAERRRKRRNEHQR